MKVGVVFRENIVVIGHSADCVECVFMRRHAEFVRYQSSEANRPLSEVVNIICARSRHRHSWDFESLKSIKI